MQYNQIPHSPSGQPANWRINISQMFSHRSESSESHARLPSLKVKYYEEEPPDHLALKASGALGETGTPLFEHAHSILY